MPRPPAPLGGVVRGFHRVANILAIALPHFPEEGTRRRQNLPRIAWIGADLIPTNEEFRSTINGREVSRTRNGKRGTRNKRLRLRLFVPRSAFRVPREVRPHPLPPALASKSRLAIAAESR